MENIKDRMTRLGAAEYAIDVRRHLHENPDVSEHEKATMEYIASNLRALGLDPKVGVAETGVTAVIEGGKTGKTIGIRADIDALPIQEANAELPYRSKNDGVMHACGHDAHTAILLGTAKLLSDMKSELSGNVKLIFQPAEESIGGAERMIKEGCLEAPHVDQMIGLHVSNELYTGEIGVKYGKMYAASDMLILRVYGKSCHGAHPSDGVDAILIAAEILTAVQSMVSRNIAPTDSAVCTFGTIHGGNVRNQIADFVELTGIIRTLDPDTRLYARNRVREIAEKTAEMMGGRAELIVEPSYSPLINDDATVDLVRDVAGGIVGKDNVKLIPLPSLGVEDFAYFAMERPSCFWHLGSRKKGEPYLAAHSQYFDIDENAIPIGVEIEAASVLAMLND